jgi:hypothetical protein
VRNAEECKALFAAGFGCLALGTDNVILAAHSLSWTDQRYDAA